jgi:long-chain acyl-CoA synthetase
VPPATAAEWRFIWMILKDILQRHIENDKIMLMDSAQKISYRDFRSKAILLSDDLASSVECLTNCNNIGLLIKNSVEYALGYFAITLLNKTIVPIPVTSKQHEIQNIIEFCELDFIITTTAALYTFSQFAEKLTYTLMVYCIDDRSIHSFGDRQRDEYTPYHVADCDENKIAILLQTSGSTNNPKKVMLTHRNLITNVKANICALGLVENDITLIALPMHFGYCNTSQFLCHLYLGATIVIMDGLFFPIKMGKYIQEHLITNVSCIPTMLLAWLNMYDRMKVDLSSLRLVSYGGGGMPVEKLKEIMDLYPSCGFAQTYGLTEASTRIAVLPVPKRYQKLGAVGTAIDGVTIRVIDEYGKDATQGEVIVSGPNIMYGYYKNPQATQEVLKNGWLYTGDIGRLDEDDYLYIIGRRKNIIINEARNIYPEEVEEVLINHPDVLEALVYGVPDKMSGEVAYANVVLKKDRPDSNMEQILINYCLGLLSAYKTPRKIFFVRQLKKTNTNKIKRTVR